MEIVELYSYSVIKKHRAQGKTQYSKTVMIKKMERLMSKIL